MGLGGTTLQFYYYFFFLTKKFNLIFRLCGLVTISFQDFMMLKIFIYGIVVVVVNNNG